tara:strand:+ start:828 stop:1214 length:387 start_codon:yes stop_codon:yes gene_type:complete
MAYKDNITSYGFGQLGSMFTDTANNQLVPPTGKVFVAITFIADTELETLGTNAGGLTADTSVPDTQYIGTDVAAHNLTDGNATEYEGELGQIIDGSNTFPRGVTIYGRWKSIEIGNGKTGALIAYLGF